MAIPLTDKQKQDKKAIEALDSLHARVLGAFNFKQIATWGDFYGRLGLQVEDKRPITYAEVKSHLDKQKQELQEKLSPKTEPMFSNGSGANYNLDKLADYAAPNKECTEQQLVNRGIDKVEIKVIVEERCIKKEVSNDYGLIPSTQETISLFWFQKKAAAEILEKIEEGKRGILLLAGTGLGKTYIIGAVMRRLWDKNYHDGKTYSHIPYLWITKTTVVEQASRVLKKGFALSPINDVEVINIEQLRAKAGQYWLKRTEVVVNGENEDKWDWKKNISPCVIALDESQGAKNAGSTQTKIVLAYPELPKNNVLISISATPFVRVSEAKYWAISTHASIGNRLIAGRPSPFPDGAILSSDTWPTYASLIAGDSDTTEYNQSAVTRLMEDLENYVVRVTGARPQFKAHNTVKVIPFENEEKRKRYESAWERFLKEKAKVEEAQEAGVDAGMCMFTILLKFSMAAELEHAEHFAADMYRAVNEEGKAAVCAVKFKQTIIEVVKILNEKYKVPRSLVSLIWGGGQTQLTQKQKAKNKIKELEEKFKAMGIDTAEMIIDTGLEDVEDRVLQDLPAHLRLGPQSMDERQVEIDKFQSGQSLYCLYSFKSGGVGLSLHHTDELTAFKCRRKESGYAVEEDIPLVPVRPRKNHIALTYNAIELVQSVGRCPRLTSLSDTEQAVYAYAGTIEMDIGTIVSQKLRCLTSVVKIREDWQDVIMKGSDMNARVAKMQELIATTENIKSDEEGALVGDGEEGEE